jgi:peptidase C25-like protein
VSQWRGNLLVGEDAAQMTNANRLSVFVMMTCLNGYFDDPAVDSLAESLLKTERGGAVAVWASSGMSLPAEQAVMNRELYGLMFGAGATMRLGEATRAAKAAISDIDIRRTWVLIGDPTMRIK